MLVLLASAALAATPTWSQISQNTGWTHEADVATSDAGTVAISTRTIEGVQCFRAVSVTEASVDKLAEVAADIPSAMKWSTAGLTESVLLGKSGGTYQYYQYLDVPGWTMASDRFWFLEGTLEKTDAGAQFRWKRLENGGVHGEKYKAFLEAHSDAVEPPINVGGWVFAPKDGKTEVQYNICTDSGGSIPTMVQTAATRKTLPDTVSDLVREAKKRSK
jgi:hypothetical protein